MIIREVIWLRQFADKIERQHHVSQDEVDETLAKQPPVRRMRRSFGSKVRSSDVSFTPGFSPVMHEDMKRRTVLTVYSSVRKMKPLNISKLRQLEQQENR